MLSLIELLNWMAERGAVLKVVRDPSSRGLTILDVTQSQTGLCCCQPLNDADLRASGGVLLLHALEKVVGKVRAAGKNDAPPTQEATMACPSCDASMQCVSSKVQDHEAKWHCPRCGTTSAVDGQVWVPKLVERVREFVTLGLGSFGPADAGKRQTFLQALSVTGVLEAAFLPDDRPKP